MDRGTGSVGGFSHHVHLRSSEPISVLTAHAYLKGVSQHDVDGVPEDRARRGCEEVDPAVLGELKESWTHVFNE